MLNTLRPALARLLTPVGEALARTPVTPNALTVTGTVGVSGATLGLFPIGQLFAGAAVATVFVFTDMLDGMLARVKGTSGPWGAFLDSTLDRVGDASVFSGLVLWFMLGGRNHLLAGVALYCLVSGLLVSYVKARAEGLRRAVRPWRAVHSGHRAMGARRGEHDNPVAADAFGVPLRDGREQGERTSRANERVERTNE
jgi:CDP-diacylglycerol---glycerol-3-phosphate 3-phosphatidyltransferase